MIDGRGNEEPKLRLSTAKGFKQLHTLHGTRLTPYDTSSRVLHMLRIQELPVPTLLKVAPNFGDKEPLVPSRP